MSLTEAQSIDDLYAAVAGYDLVVVPDGPLSRALNRRLDRPHLGTFAVTPRSLAADRIERSEARTAFLQVIQETTLDWKQAAYTIDIILGCWEHERSAGAIRSYDTYVDSATDVVLDEFESIETTSHRLTEYQIDSDIDLAVVGPSQYTPLETSIFPDEYDTVELFTESTVELPSLHVFASATEIVEAVIETIDGADPAHVAIVLDRNSPYSQLVEAALEAADIPFYGGPGFVDHPAHRACLQLLRASFRGSNIRVKTVRPLIEFLDLEIPTVHDEKRLYSLDLPAADELTSVFDLVADSSLLMAVHHFEEASGADCSALRDELSTLGIAGDTVTPTRVEQLSFYLQTYDVPVNRDNEGVLLADSDGAMFVDRPTVFYLGLDEGWTHSPPNRPWVSAGDFYDRHLNQFQLLLQNGVERHYLVEDTRGGEPVTPCLYFDELFEADIDRFTDFDHQSHHRHSQSPQQGFESEPMAVDTESIELLSQSSLNTYLNSPRDYLFSQVLESTEKDYFTAGSLFHDFAELYVNHPERVDDSILEEIVDIMVESTECFHREATRGLHRTEYRIGLETIAAYLDAHPTQRDALAVPDSSDSFGNHLAEHFEWELTNQLAEYSFESLDQQLKGTIDLIHQADRILDYKSGARKTAGSVVSGASMDPPADTPDFQALLYLAYFRELNPNTELEFTFVHFLETVADALDGTLSLSETETTVTYYPQSFAAYVRAESTFEYLRDAAAKKCQKTLSKTTFDVYHSVVESHAIPESRDSDAFIDSPLGRAMEAALKEAVGDYKYVTKGTKQLFRELARVRSRNFFKDDMLAFESFLADRIEELNNRRAGEERFPIEGPAGEPSYRRVNHRDLLIDNE